MSVYERKYRIWDGDATPQWQRFLILPRYALREVFQSRLLLAYFVLCFLFPLACTLFIYLANNSDFLQMVPEFDLSQIFTVGPKFFLVFLRVQCVLAFFLTVFVGPGLISRDLANNGLPLYLSRPFSRTEYVLGKLAILSSLLSAVTWLVGFVLLTVHVNFTGLGWLRENLRLAVGLFVGSWIAILAFSFLAMAVSAWVRWKAVAGFGMLVLGLAGAFFGLMIRALFDTPYGDVINGYRVLDTIWAGLLGARPASEMPLAAAWIALGLFLGAMFLLLERKLRAYQVVS